ncbi:protein DETOXIFICATION 24-like [Impatiens glandulifera]|uniref:protein DETOXIFICATION 24-like n=1 Tax=Impatiens glandulifera TaxID=253017 RepID=UPI001FB0C622|nr:protein DETOXIFICATION 24-like [Impatiens glandulifera]
MGEERTLEERLVIVKEEGDEELDLKKRVWEETKKIWIVAFPGMLSRASNFGMVIIAQVFIGHVSALDLAAFALVQSLTLRFINGILIGMSSATETLCGQAFGAGQHHMMGIYLQRSWIVNLITVTLLTPLFIFSAPIFIGLGQDKDVSIASETMSLWLIPLMYLLVFSFTIQMYLQAQLKNKIVAWLSIASVIVQIFFSWIFVFKLDFGTYGALGSFILSNIAVVLSEFIYIFCGGCPLSWKGFSLDAFSQLWPVIKLSVSSGIMLCLEVWYNSILILIAGYMKNATVAIAAFSICLNVSVFEFMICLGFLGAACVRVANELGRGDAKSIKFSIKVNLATSLIFGIVFFTLCLVFGNKIGYLFTSDEDVINMVSELSILLAVTMFSNSIQPVLTGIVVGAGLQSVVAIINLVCYYVIGIPIGLLLGFCTDLQVRGVWIGMICGTITQIICLSIMIWRTNWDDQVEKASQRISRWSKPDESS